MFEFCFGGNGSPDFLVRELRWWKPKSAEVVLVLSPAEYAPLAQRKRRTGKSIKTFHCWFYFPFLLLACFLWRR